jgi:hypothetical protein
VTLAGTRLRRILKWSWLLLPASPLAALCVWSWVEVLEWGVPHILLVAGIVCGIWFFQSAWRTGAERAEFESSQLRMIRAVGAGLAGLAFGGVLGFMVVGVLILLALPAIAVAGALDWI